MADRETLTASRDAGAYAVGKALFELLTEEQQRARQEMESAGRRNAIPAAIDAAVSRIFEFVAQRAMEVLERERA